MTSFLKNHPFAVEAFFERSLVLTFAVPKAELEHRIPPCVELDTFDEKWAFVAVAMVQTKSLRPKGWPRFMGNDFFLIGYRIFVRYHDSRGKRLRGLYILGSATDKKKMERLGNIFTHYKYTTTDIALEQGESSLIVRSDASKLLVNVSTQEGAGLPLESPFSDWKTARRYAGPLPFTFTYKPEKEEVLIIEGVRQQWKPRPVSVLEHQVGFVEDMKLDGAVLANAFLIEQVPYWWKKGKIESWPR